MLSDLKELSILILKLSVDIAFLSFLIYRVLSFSYDPRIIGAIIFFSALFILNSTAKLLGLFATSWITEKFAEYSILILIVLFQPELRRTILGIRLKIFEKNIDERVLEEIGRACEYLSKRREGCIIVIERSVDITPLVQGGKVLDSELSAELLVSIFNKGSPTHDGAVIIRKGKIYMIKAILPLSNKDFDIPFGTRHKAGIGITEESDAISIIISEETGRISVAYRGNILPNIPPSKIKDIVQEFIGAKQKEKSKPKLFGFLKKS